MSRADYTSLTDLHLNSKLAAFPQTHRSGGSESVQLIKTQRSASEVLFPPMPELVVGIVLDGDFPFRFDVGSGWSSTRRLQAGDIRVCLPDTEARYECGGDYNLLLVSLPGALVNRLVCDGRETGAKILEPLHTQTAFRDDVVRALAHQLWSESAHGDPASALMVDGLTQALVAQLMRRVDDGWTRQRSHLNTWPVNGERALRTSLNLLRACDYIEAHLGQPLSVAELAAEAGMSPSHFSRSFKAATGQAVWAYVQDLRCERARELLQFTRDPIAAIAHRCGFASQAHLTSCFKRIYGVTPATIRRS